MKINLRWLTIIMIVALVFGGCSAGDNLSLNRLVWDKNSPSHYAITVRHTQSVWHSQDITLTVDGSVVSHSARCTPAPTEGKECEIEAYDPDDYTVEGLFQIASDLLDGNYADHVIVTFDPDYGFPTGIRLDDPDLIDEDQIWSVVDFEVLDE